MGYGFEKKGKTCTAKILMTFECVQCSCKLGWAFNAHDDKEKEGGG
jgi:hypothetical protein